MSDLRKRVFFKKIAGKVETVRGFEIRIIVKIAWIKAEKRLRRGFRLFGTRGRARVSLEKLLRHRDNAMTQR